MNKKLKHSRRKKEQKQYGINTHRQQDESKKNMVGSLTQGMVVFSQVKDRTTIRMIVKNDHSRQELKGKIK